MWSTGSGLCFGQQQDVHSVLATKPILTGVRAADYPRSKQFLPAESADAELQAQSSGALKWRARQPQQFQTHQLVSGQMPATGSAVRGGEVSPAVNLVPVESALELTAPRVAQSRSRFGDSGAPTPAAIDDLAPPELPSLGPPETTPPAQPPTDIFEVPPTPRGGSSNPFNRPSDDRPRLPPVGPSTPRPAGPAELDNGNGAAEEQKKEEDSSCRQTYREVDCCSQSKGCNELWKLVEENQVRDFSRGFIDITPLYNPDVRAFRRAASGTGIPEEQSRAQGFAINALRVWKNVDGKPFGLLDGEVLGLDGFDWEADWKRRAEIADLNAEGQPPMPEDFKGRAVDYKPGSKSVVVEGEDGVKHTFQLSQLSADDNYWLNGRPWHDKDGQVLANGRMIDYRWGRIYIATSDNRIAEVPLDTMGTDELCYVNAYWGDGIGLPDECLLQGKPYIRNFTFLAYTWTASALCHKPLYFEEQQLERYGHTPGPLVEPFMSGAHFFANIAILPYKMGIHPVNECQYALGYYRPGSCAPWMIPAVPLSVRGGLYQAGAVTGAAYLIP